MKLIFLALSLASRLDASRGECYHADGSPRRCSPPFQNIGHERKVTASNTCGLNGAETFYRQVQSSDSSSASQYNQRSLRYTCDDRDPRRQHNAGFLTDTEDKTTWWQSQTLDAADLQYPNNVTLTVNLEKAYEITYVRMKFYSPRPESMIIEKRTCETCPWVKYQYYSNTCRETFGKPDTIYIQFDNEAICDSKMSKISPLSGGEIVFPTLEGRPSNANFEQSEILQEFVTATDIRITLVRLNTFGDEIFRGTKVLQSYYYAISDLVVGAKIKCNGHASDHGYQSDRIICNCHHNTAGDDCERCLPLYNNKPWSRATSRQAEQCEVCNCNGLADSCIYDADIGHGRCIDCQRNSAGVHCETCKMSYYRDPVTQECVPCQCDENGSKSAQCNANGECQCHHGVEGEKCDRCQPKFYNIGRGGCQPCNCHIPGSMDNEPSCHPVTGNCLCKMNARGQQCKECKVGFMGAENSYGIIGPDINNPYGCVPCFCFGHSNTCTPASHMVQDIIESRFDASAEEWTSCAKNVTYNAVLGQISANEEFCFPEKFRGNQRYSYNQHLSFNLAVRDSADNDDIGLKSTGKLILQGYDKNKQLIGLECDLTTDGNPELSSEMGKYIFRISENVFLPELHPVRFVSVLNDLESVKIVFPGGGKLDMVQLGTAAIGVPGIDGKIAATHVETCEAPNRTNDGAMCTAGYTFESETNDPYQECKPCTCNKHARIPCDYVTGECKCEHNTCGKHCDTCCSGFYGNPYRGTTTDCRPCPCPNVGACAPLPKGSVTSSRIDDIPVTCVSCPIGSGGPRCELCLDNYFGDPIGFHGSQRDCQECKCSGNTNKLTTDNCDRLTGQCLKCLHNTMGSHCEQCKPGFYGNPLVPAHEQIHGKGCTRCTCSPLGSRDDVCNEVTGQCNCFPGAGGLNCDQCMEQHYGLTGGYGCESCDCDPIGSVNGECDVYTGQCQCKTGVTGLRCNRCLPNHYNYSPEGCTPCDCDRNGSLFLQCHLQTGQCECRDGVMGKQCDKCQENYFYDREILQCQQCPECYNIVQASVDQHRLEVRRLINLKNEILSNPHDFMDDAEFEREIGRLKDGAEEYLQESHGVLSVFKNFEAALEDSNSSIDQVQLQLSQFASSLETCERTVSQSSVYQQATEGTISVIRVVMNEIQNNLHDAEDQLSNAQIYAEAQKSRHGELRSLYSQAQDALERHEQESQNVQATAQSALETSKRARDQISNSLELIRSLKGRLEQVSINDVISAGRRITNLRNAAKIALENATKANHRALDLKSPKDIPDFNSINILKSATDIEASANALHEKFNVLRARLEERRFSFQNADVEASELYQVGHQLQNEADMLMAAVHASKMEATETKDNIDDIISKAEMVIENIRNLPATGAGPSVDTSEINLGDLKSDVKLLKDELSPLELEIEQAANSAQSKMDKTNISLKTAGNIGTANAQLVDDAQKFRIDTDEAVSTAQRKIDNYNSHQNLFASKTADAKELDSNVEQHLGIAQDARLKASTSEVNLQQIIVYLEKIKSMDLANVVDGLQDNALYAQRVAEATEIYKNNRASFDAYVKKNALELTQKETDCKLQNDKLLKYQEDSHELEIQVANLEEISLTMPSWCSKNSDTAESAATRRIQPSRTTDT